MQSTSPCRVQGKMPLPRALARVSCLAALVAGACCGTSFAEENEGNKFFREKIGPVLVKHCYRCHSAKAEEVQGNLLLDTREGIRKGGDNGPAIVPENVEASFLLRTIKYLEEDYQMPPAGRLPDAVIADFVKWVELGAPDPRDEPKPKRPAKPRP